MDLGEYIYRNTEGGRHTKATTNNPTSSRTHVLVFLQPIDTERKLGPSLTLCDFAGVENVFQCQDTNVLNAMATIRNKDKLAYEDLLNKKFMTKFGPLLNDVPELSGKSFSEIESMGPPVNNSKQDLIMSRVQHIETFVSQILGEKAEPNSEGKMVTALERYIGVAVRMYDNYVKFPENVKKNGKLPSNDSSTVDGYIRTKVKELTGPVGKQLLNIASGFDSDAGEYNMTKNDSKVPVVVAQKIINNGYIPTPKRASYPWLLYVIIRMLQRTSALFMDGECSNRVNEGLYINSSLSQFRKFVNKTLIARGELPSADMLSIAVQCNPYYIDCFGSAFVDPYTVPAEKRGEIGLVEQTIINKLRRDGMTDADVVNSLQFCMVNVINISKDKNGSMSTCNDPPAVPFIDASHVIFEYNRVMSAIELKHKSMPHTPEKLALTHAPFSQEGSVTPSPVYMFNTTCVENLMARTEYICASHQDALSKNPDSAELVTAAKNAETTRKDIVRACRTVLLNEAPIDTADKFYGQGVLLGYVRDLINTVERNNAPTLMGTMSFADSIAKFGLNRAPLSYEVDNAGQPIRPDYLIGAERVMKISKYLAEVNKIVRTPI